MTDSAASQVEDHTVGGGVVAGLPDELDDPARPGRGQGHTR